MKKVKLSDSEIRLLLMLFALIMLAAAYFFSFQKNVTRAQEIEGQNQKDQQTVNTLESMVGRQAEVEAQTEEYRQYVQDVIAKYPPDVTTEKAIVIIQELEELSGVHVTNISFAMDNVIGNLATAVASEPAVSDGTEDSESTGPVVGMYLGYYDTLAMTYESEYTSLKDIISYIAGLKDRTTVPAITAAYDSETGNLSGVITVNMFYLTNTGKEYEAPRITGINKGVEDIFRSGGNAVGEVAEDEEGQEE